MNAVTRRAFPRRPRRINGASPLKVLAAIIPSFSLAFFQPQGYWASRDGRPSWEVLELESGESSKNFNFASKEQDTIIQGFGILSADSYTRLRHTRMRIWDECGGFFREFRREFRTTGAIMPSSPFLAKALAGKLGGPRSAARILEVGPGTGAVTRAIARRMVPEDRLDAVEINRGFVELLKHRLEEDKAFLACAGQIHVIHGALEDLPGESVYDFIVSGLPLNNFGTNQVRDIFAAYQRLLKPGGTLTYYEYTLVRQLKAPFVNRHERWRLLRVGRVVNSFIRDYQIDRERILINVPPATVRHLQLKPAELACP